VSAHEVALMLVASAVGRAAARAVELGEEDEPVGATALMMLGRRDVGELAGALVGLDSPRLRAIAAELRGLLERMERLERDPFVRRPQG